MNSFGMESILFFDFERSKYCENCIPATKIKLLFLSETVRYAHQNFRPNSEDPLKLAKFHDSSMNSFGMGSLILFFDFEKLSQDGVHSGAPRPF